MKRPRLNGRVARATLFPLSASMNLGLALLLAVAIPRPSSVPPEAELSLLVGPGRSADDPCTVAIPASIYDRMVEMGVKDWAAACSEARKLQ